mgnify:CR=1 FL=1
MANEVANLSIEALLDMMHHGTRAQIKAANAEYWDAAPLGGELRDGGIEHWVERMEDHVSPDFAAHLREHRHAIAKPFLLKGDGGNNPIIMAGFSWATPLSVVAPEYPGINFVIIDMVVDRGRDRRREPAGPQRPNRDVR